MGNSEILLLRNFFLLRSQGFQSATCLLAAKAVSPSWHRKPSCRGSVASCCIPNHAKRRDVTARPDLPARINVQYAKTIWTNGRSLPRSTAASSSCIAPCLRGRKSTDRHIRQQASVLMPPSPFHSNQQLSSPPRREAAPAHPNKSEEYLPG